MNKSIATTAAGAFLGTAAFTVLLTGATMVSKTVERRRREKRENAPKTN